MEAMDRRRFIGLLGSTPALAAWPLLAACQEGGRSAVAAQPAASTTATLPPADPLSHLLRRTRFATTQADLTRARELGLQGYLDEQLSVPSSLDLIYLEADARYPVTALPPPVNLAINVTPQQATQQLSERTLFLAAYSDAQLYELVVDFWTNHFNIENVTGELPLHKLYDDRQVIRAHALGTFGELLLASARSPAMLEYLDAVNNVASGPNENYARELMELHTLGVDGGYTEQDVREVARCFTGWAINGLTRVFEFQAANHDDGEKQVLGHVIPAGGGVTDGEKVLQILAEHPSTARFIATKLARRFVSDSPPDSLVTTLAGEFTRTRGDIPAVLRRLFATEEFFAAADDKFRRPLEFVAHLLRNTRADRLGFDSASMLNVLSRMGQIPHRWFPPDGFPDRASHWMNTSVLLEYWNQAAEFVENTDTLGRSVVTDAVNSSTDVDELVDVLASQFVQRPLRESDRQLLSMLARTALPAETAPTAEQAVLVAGLLIASPYFSLR